MPKDRARRTLLHQARTVSPTSCGDLATRLELEPPHTIHRVTQALESLMAEDVAAGPTLLAALCMSRSQQSLHARGFFTTEQAERDFAGDPESPPSRAFHVLELQRALAFCRQSR